MAMSVDYARPVQVNGFTCRNCTDVDLAKKHIDPSHPQSGPYDVNAATDPTQSAAVRFTGALSGVQPAAPTTSAAQRPGLTVDLRV